jgi:hypothetical protein
MPALADHIRLPHPAGELLVELLGGWSLLLM